MSPTRPCPLCDADMARFMCFSCGHRLCEECVVLEDGLCPECGGTTWVDMTGYSVPEYHTADEEEEEDCE